MAVTFTTPLMSLVLPTVGPSGQVGPTWASDLNTALQLVDSHNHASGAGAQVPTAGLNINADLTFANYNATNVNSVRLVNQTAVLSASGDKSSVYVKGGDLYFNNSAGTAVQVTSGSGINAGSIGGIGGDYATAGASEYYTNATKTFTFTQTSGVTAKIACGDITVYENVASAQGITIKSPTSLGAAYSLTLPTALPGSQKIVTIDSSGVISPAYTMDGTTIAASGGTIGVITVPNNAITTAKILDSNVTTAKIADSNVTTAKILDGAVTSSKIAAGSVGFTQLIPANANFYNPILNTTYNHGDLIASFSLSTNSRPVMVGLCFVSQSTGLTTGAQCYVDVKHNGVTCACLPLLSGTNIYPLYGFDITPGTGSVTYTFVANCSGTTIVAGSAIAAFAIEMK